LFVVVVIVVVVVVVTLGRNTLVVGEQVRMLRGWNKWTRKVELYLESFDITLAGRTQWS